MLAKRHANVIEELVVWREKDTTISVDRIVDEYRAAEDEKKPAAIVVDATGFGIPVADQLRRTGLPIVRWVSSEDSAKTTLYRNKRSEMWHLGRDWFAGRTCHIPNDEELIEELADRLAAPVVKAMLGKAVIPDDSPYSVGGIGLVGTRPAQEAIENCDTLLLIGWIF